MGVRLRRRASGRTLPIVPHRPAPSGGSLRRQSFRGHGTLGPGPGQGKPPMSTASAAAPARVLTQGHKKVIFASSLGTVFEWYDFYLYGSLAAIIAKQFFSALNPTGGFIFALLAFAAGFAVRPFGALLFGRLGDLVGRKRTFLVTIVIMGAATFLVGVLPGYGRIGIAAPIALVTLRLLQGLAL